MMLGVATKRSKLINSPLLERALLVELVDS